jgi:hypothetical protein
MIHDHTAAIRNALESAGNRDGASGVLAPRATDWRRSASAVYERLAGASSSQAKTTVSRAFEDLAVLDFLFRRR